MREWIQFVADYPIWVKVSIGALVAAIVALLIAFAPSRTDSAKSPAVPASEPPKVGREIVLDLSDNQANWSGLTSWASASRLGIVQLEKPFGVSSFDKDSPGVLILPLPHDKLLSDSKVRAIKSWVERGGGLLVLGYYAADSHHGTNISRLTREWGVSFSENLLMPSGATQVDTRRHVFAADEKLGVRIPVGQQQSKEVSPIVAGVRELVVLSSASLDIAHAPAPLILQIDSPASTDSWEPTGPRTPDGMRPLIEEWVLDGPRSVPVVIAFKAGRGKVAVAGTWKLATLDFADNLQLVQNLVNWLRP